MAKKLRGYVTANGETYGPDDTLPADVEKSIDNPKAFDENYDNRTPAQKKADEVSAEQNKAAGTK